MTINVHQLDLSNLLENLVQNFLKVEQRNERNSRNGYYERTLDTRYGKIDDLTVPRDRNGDFQTQLFEPYQRRDGWRPVSTCTKVV